MSHLSQIWKLLRTCVRGHWLKEMLKKAPLTAKAVSRLGKIINKHGKRVEFSPSNCKELRFQERVQKSLEKWTKSRSCLTSNKGKQQLYEEIYELLGGGTLRTEILEQVMGRLMANNEFHPVLLFQRLEDFYRRWCQGEFIDGSTANNLPLKKMLKMQAQNISIGLRQIDINTGLNVMILLLELHRYAQERDDLKHQIVFYPSGQRDKDHFFTSQLLRIINYSDAIEIGNFSNVVGEFLRGGNYKGAYLGDANLTSVNFSCANLSSAYLGDANLTATNFSGANLSTANLGDANLSGANLSGANLKRTDLSSANLSGANLSGANLCHANLSSADLSSADLSGANLKGANLTSANLRDAKLSGANLTDTIFFGANLSDAKLNGVDFSHADLCRADLSGADLTQALLKGTNLSDTILFSTDLTDAILVAADLSYAKLNGAKLNGANLKGALLLGADLSGVDLNGVILNEADLSGVLLFEADLSGADLSDAMLFGTDLSYANLSSANLSGSNLSGAILSGADLSCTDLSYAILGDADLSDANLEDMTWNENLEWQSVRGLDTAVNVPKALKEKLDLL
ncbi:pentapeptide repeat-containing protein [Mastigocladopsis repens]|uniref:pentapeptide repeat-containing protein n=1 Tax=Mastigocladopsis repens TaxID=221287 RepID=UPI0004749155|nr:pentapeptide repeat-containing protein [Mastigocladopsis repens]